MAETISSEVAENKETLLAIAVGKFGNNLDESLLVVDDTWSYHYTKMIPSHTSDRLVLFRAKPPSKQFGCVRVRDRGNITKTVWDVIGQEGPYIGLVPAGSPFEAMMVEIKLVTQS